MCLYATDPLTSLASLVHPFYPDWQEGLSSLGWQPSTEAYLASKSFVYDNKASINRVGATNTRIGTWSFGSVGNASKNDPNMPNHVFTPGNDPEGTPSSVNENRYLELNDERVATHLQVDTYKDYNTTFNNERVVASFLTNMHFLDNGAGSPAGQKTEVGMWGGHMYGHTTCWHLGACHGSQKPGSACGRAFDGTSGLASLNMVDQKDPQFTDYVQGFCFVSEQGNMDCGRGVYTRPRHVSTPVRVAEPTVMRCPSGTPSASTYATTEVARTLIAGCMIAADAHYLPNAEVHVPQMCKAPANHPDGPGCLFPGALNYAPGKVQPGACR